MKQRIGIVSFIANIICLLLLVGSLIYLNAIWDSLPDQIPTRFDFHGNVIRYSGKGMLLIMPFFSWLFFLILSLIEWIPNILNSDKHEEPANIRRRNVFFSLKLLIVIVFLFISSNQIGTNLPGWFSIVVVFLIFGLGKYLIYNVIKKWD